MKVDDEFPNCVFIDESSAPNNFIKASEPVIAFALTFDIRNEIDNLEKLFHIIPVVHF